MRKRGKYKPSQEADAYCRRNPVLPLEMAWKPETVFRFGKYKGKPIMSIWSSDQSYVEWCIREVDGFVDRLLDEIKRILQKPKGPPPKPTPKNHQPKTNHQPKKKKRKHTLHERLLENIRDIESAGDEAPEIPGELDAHTAHSPDTAPW